MASPQITRWISGALLMVAAVVAIALPFLSATALTVGFGGLAIAAGIAQLLRIGQVRGALPRLLRVITAILYGAGGLWILVNPVEGEISLTLFLGLLLVAEGVMELAGAAGSSAPARGLVLADGLVTALLGGLLVAEWPSDSLWAVGTLFGISLAVSAINLLTAPHPPEGPVTPPTAS